MNNRLHILICTLLLLLCSVLQAQPTPPAPPEPVKMSFDKDGVSMIINRKDAGLSEDSILRDLGFVSGVSLDSSWRVGERGLTGKGGWELVKLNSTTIILAKSLARFAEGMHDLHSEIYLLDDNEWLGIKGPLYTLYPDAQYGVNKFKIKSISTLSNGKVRFYLPGNQQAKEVILSGSFNSWSTVYQTMNYTDSGWIAELELAPGKYLYKFIVDGRWINDVNNKLDEADGHGGVNSVYFRYNHRFYLPEHQAAKKVFVTGSFNDWKEKELAMEKWLGGWFLEMYIKDGTHAYKFIADKDWILDPNNPDIRPDGMGNENSYFSLGKATIFSLDGYTSAKSVTLAGQFNVWNGSELPMQKTADGWKINYVVGPGNYQYKFVVDGEWINDPASQHMSSEGGYQNSLIAVNPNYRFYLKGYDGAKSVAVSGNFNGWNETGYSMARDDNGWYISLYLKPGKYTYKFIVDGKWILDPDNTLWEENEYGTGNSVLWIETSTTANP